VRGAPSYRAATVGSGCFLALTLLAQEIDTSNFGHNRRSAGLAERAETEVERRAFTELQDTVDPARRRTLADAFLSRYPQSWLLSGVYHVAAAASLELKDYERVLTDGRTSLRLLPENAPLLLALANIEVMQGKLAQARQDADDALLWLSISAPLAGVKTSDWNKTRDQLEEHASAILKRAGGTAAAPVRSQSRKEKGEKYAGSEACRECHSEIYESWRKTGMSRMLQPAAGAKILADFSSAVDFRDRTGRVVARTGGGARPYFEFESPGAGWKRFRVDYTIGSKWQQAYATRLGDERIFVFPIQFNALQKRWLNYWATIDPPGSERADVARFPELSDATSYQRNCAVCHTSQLRLMRLDDSSMQRAMFHEPGVNCEMCHGPSAGHVVAIQSGNAGANDPAAPPFRFARVDHREATLVCGQCHRQSALRDLGSKGEMNYRSEKPYFARLASPPYSEFGARAFYKDGRFRETTFIGEAFMRSACFRRGQAQCASCHNPHPPDAAANRNSLKFRANPDQMCLQCHPQIGARVAEHTHHAPESAGSRCTACHMPPIMNALVFRAASHQVDDIPRADFTARFGAQDSPNACLICHTGRTIEWVAPQLDHWSDANR
jgi:predicted CXXCH cytochrome family protein